MEVVNVQLPMFRLCFVIIIYVWQCFAGVYLAHISNKIIKFGNTVTNISYKTLTVKATVTPSSKFLCNYK